MKILLLGCQGQLGWELQRSLAPLGEVLALDAGSPGLGADFTLPEALAATVRSVAPQVIVNAAAYTAVDRAESEPALAHQINAAGPALLAREAERLGAWLIHYSTDYVFDGQGCRPWTEADAPAPLNVYGRSKLEGERAVQAHGRHLLLRSSWLHGPRGDNFARTMLRLAGEREVLSVVDDQVGAPTGADLLADLSAHALRAALARPSLAGLYHVCAQGETSWHGYAAYVIGQARQRHPQRVLKVRELRPVPSSGHPTPAPRPLNSRLDCRRFEQAFGLRLPTWQPGVDRLLAELC